ncbi:MAG: HAD family phosphatase [Candidatus Omnitrophica bacterium]|nr:HAD family phosphatase [Candidatus Omnitrophota bacterium]
MKHLVKKPAAILFDMDGVIVDSMPYHFLAWYEALRPYGVRVSCFEVYRREGEQWDKSLSDFLRMGGYAPTTRLMRTVFAARQKIFRKYFTRTLFPKVEDFLAGLADRGYTLALVTGTPHDQVAHILPASVKSSFSCMVTGDTVRRGKPHPEPYLKAARLLRLSPHECVVVENAPFGIESAKRAGMFCIALTTSLPAGYLSGADHIADTLEEIPVFIERACGQAGKRRQR